jgi:hypothetical protein
VGVRREEKFFEFFLFPEENYKNSKSLKGLYSLPPEGTRAKIL